MGIALIDYDPKTKKFSEKTNIGNTPITSFLETIASNKDDVVIIKNALEADLQALSSGNKPSSTYPSVNISEERFKSEIWGGNINLYAYYANLVKNEVGSNIWGKLSIPEQTALFSLNYNSSSLIGSGLKRGLSLYTSASKAEDKMVGKLRCWYEILYRSNGGNDRKGVQNRRFMEADAFLGNIHNKISEGDHGAKNNSIIPVSNFAEANAAIAFMNYYSEKMISYLGGVTGYTNRNYEIVQNNFSSAIQQFLTGMGYTKTYFLGTLFTNWNIYTDLAVNDLMNGVNYKEIKGSKLNDLVFITNKDGGTARVEQGNDEVYGSSAKDIVYTGSGKDKVYTGAGNDEVNTKDEGSKNDENIVFLGKGSDTFVGGSGEDNVDGGSGFTSDQTVISAADMTDEAGDTNTVHLGGGDDYYTGGKGTDKVWGEADSDIIHGNEGNDYLYGDNGDDFLYGEDGNDTIEGGQGNDYIEGGDGNDIIDSGSGLDERKHTNTVDLGTGADRFTGSIGVDNVTSD